ncbi:KH domain-containing protein [Candidatus Falkowbacteria bacterium]|nr:KH domain-containing protein [Candidatus Falkowbacteria bacterium]
MPEFDQEFATVLVKAIVSKPEAVVIDRIVDDRGVLLTVHVDQSDLGYVIGKQGATAQSLRTILKAIGAKSNARINLKIDQPDRQQA